jgi:hypothetical protein
MASPDLTAPPTLRVVTPKPKMTIYYALLIISLCAMLVACLFLYLEIRRFGGFGAVQGRVSALDRPSATLLADRVGRAFLSATVSMDNNVITWLTDKKVRPTRV